MAPRKLVNLEIGELSLCGEGINKHAKVSILKAKPTIPIDESDAAVQSRLPAVDPSLKETDMATIEELTKQVADLTKSRDDAVSALKAADVPGLTKRAETAEAELAKAKADIDKAKTDETIKVGDVEVRKSVVGDATFTMFKAQQAQIVAAEDRATMVELTKAAEAAYPSLPGTPALKGAVLKAIGTMDKATGDALVTMLKSGEAAMKSRFSEIGGGGGGEPGTGLEEFNKMAEKYATDHKVTIEKATIAVMETPEGAQAYSRYKAEKSRAAMMAN